MAPKTENPKFKGDSAQPGERASVASAQELIAIGRRCAALPDLDSRSAEDILGYDEKGLPS